VCYNYAYTKTVIVFDHICVCVWKIAQQEAQRAQYVVDKAKQERQQKIVQAEGEAAAAKLVSFEYCLEPESALTSVCRFKNSFFFVIEMSYLIWPSLI